MNEEIKSVWAVVERVNPHISSSGSKRTVVVFPAHEEAANFYLLHPQYHYKLGQTKPVHILEIEEIPLGKVVDWWKPSFP